MLDVDAVLDGLRAGALDDLVRLAVDDLLDRPLEDLLPRERVVEQLVGGFRSALERADTEAWVRERLQELEARVARLDRPLSRAVPARFLRPVEVLLGRPHVPDQELVRAIVDHAAFRALVREMLVEVLQDFGRVVRSVVPAGRGGRLGGLAGLAGGVVGALGAELDRQLQGRIGPFVDGAMQRAVDLWVRRLGDPARAPQMAAWRVEALRSVLALSPEVWRREVAALDLPGAVHPLAEALREVAAWDGLEGEVRRAVDAAWDELGGRPLRELVAGSGLEEDARAVLQESAARWARELVDTPRFRAWLEGLAASAGD